MSTCRTQINCFAARMARTSALGHSRLALLTQFQLSIHPAMVIETRKLPRILSSRSLAGVAAAYTRRNMAWNDDGQLLLVTRQAVTVAVSSPLHDAADARHRTSPRRLPRRRCSSTSRSTAR
jgi:hypothetical protein